MDRRWCTRANVYGAGPVMLESRNDRVNVAALPELSGQVP